MSPMGPNSGNSGSLLRSMGMGQPAQRPPASVRDQIMGPASLESNLDPAAGAKSSREDAAFVPASQRCGVCLNFSPETGECSQVEGQMTPEDSCIAYFEQGGGAGGEMPMDAGIQAGGAPQSGGGPLGA